MVADARSQSPRKASDTVFVDPGRSSASSSVSAATSSSSVRKRPRLFETGVSEARPAEEEKDMEGTWDVQAEGKSSEGSLILRREAGAKQKGKYRRRSGRNMKKLIFKEGDAVLLGGPVGPLPHGWNASVEGSWKIGTDRGGRFVSDVGTKPRGAEEELNLLGEEIVWKRGKIRLVASARSHVELEDGRLVCAWNHELNQAEI